MADETKLPKQDLLLKILNMTTAENDGQALVAVRKANALLAEAGWSWEKLLLGKITVVADPFSSIKAPPKSTPNDTWGRPQTPPKPQPARPAPPPPPPPSRNVPPRPTATAGAFSGRMGGQTARDDLDPWSPSYRSGPQTAAAAPPKSSASFGTKKNIYAQFCYCCGDHVPVQAGFIFNPSDHNQQAADKWVAICAPCNRSKPRVQSSPAKRRQPLHASIDPTIQGAAPTLKDL